MSAAPEGDANASKAGNENNATDKAEEVKKPAGTMDGDDEWEEFPAQDWPDEDQELPGGNAHLWEAGWDDDDANNEFVKQLKQALASTSSKKGASTNTLTEKNSKALGLGKEAKAGAKLAPIPEAPEPHLADHEDEVNTKNTKTPSSTTAAFEDRT